MLKSGPDALGQRDNTISRCDWVGSEDRANFCTSRFQPVNGLGRRMPTVGTGAALLQNSDVGGFTL